MTLPVPDTALEISIARLDLLQSHRPAHPSARMLFEEVSALRQPLIDQSWKAMSAQASRCLGLGYAAFRSLQGELMRARRLDALREPIAEGFAGLLQAAAKSEKSAEFAQVIKQKLSQAGPGEGPDAVSPDRGQSGAATLSPPLSERIDVDDSFEKLANGRTKGVSLLAPFSQSAGGALAQEAERTGNYALLSLNRGLQASVHAEFNLALNSVSPRIASGAAADRLSAVKLVVDAAESRLRQGQQRLYGALAAKKPMPEVADIAASLAGDIERFLPMFVRTQATMRALMLALREQGKGTAAKKMGRLAMRAGALTREAIASHCASYRLALAALSPQPADDVADLLRKTDSLAFSPILPDGKNTALKALDSSIDGKFVEVEGFVNAVDAGRQGDGKLIGHVELFDPASGDTADAVAVFAHLPHAGVTKDSFCRLHGTFKAESALFEGKPAVETDMLSLGEISEASWQIAFLRLADRWFQPWRNASNLYWSLGPHGAGDDGEGFFGAGELLFTPFMRK